MLYFAEIGSDPRLVCHQTGQLAPQPWGGFRGRKKTHMYSTHSDHARNALSRHNGRRAGDRTGLHKEVGTYFPEPTPLLPQSLIDRIETRYTGSWRGVTAFRSRVDTAVRRIYRARVMEPRQTPELWRARVWARRHAGLCRQAEHLAALAEIDFRERGSSRGSYRRTLGIDWVPPTEARKAPYCDLGGEGLGVVQVTRTTVYAKSCTWRPSSTTERYLVGRNEAGTYFSHRVPADSPSVRAAVTWIWHGYAERILERQGDVALISGNGGPRLPPSGLPAGHTVDSEHGVVTHATHPTLRLPGKGERLIVGRRALPRGHGAATQTRD